MHLGDKAARPYRIAMEVDPVDATLLSIYLLEHFDTSLLILPFCSIFMSYSIYDHFLHSNISTFLLSAFTFNS
jgi:hypothetical protein